MTVKKPAKKAPPAKKSVIPVFDDVVDELDIKPTEIILDETPEPEFDIDNLPSRLTVENKKSGQQFTVNSKYFLANRGELKLV